MFSKPLYMALCSAFILCSCTSSKYIANEASKYNYALEKHNNEQLLLNIIRASQHRPIYFSAFSKFSGRGYAVESGASLNIGPTNEAYTMSPKITANPTFDVAPLDTQEFMRGFLQPVKMETVEYYWSLGWPKSILLSLIVSRVKMEDGTILKNYPPDKNDYKSFSEYLEKIIWSENRVELLPSKKVRVGPPVTISSPSDLKDILKAVDGGSYSVKTTGDKIQIYENKIEYSFCKQKLKQDTCDSQAKNDGGASLGDGKVSLGDGNDAILRSPEGIIYFLGEIVRAELENGEITIGIACDGKIKPASILLVRKATPEDKNPYVEVAYEGVNYVIPRLPNDAECDGQHSMQVITLVQQFIELNKSGKDLPTTESVRIQ